MQLILSVSGNVKDFGYKVGLRAESSNYNGELMTTIKNSAIVIR